MFLLVFYVYGLFTYKKKPVLHLLSQGSCHCYFTMNSERMQNQFICHFYPAEDRAQIDRQFLHSSTLFVCKGSCQMISWLIKCPKVKVDLSLIAYLKSLIFLTFQR